MAAFVRDTVEQDIIKWVLTNSDGTGAYLSRSAGASDRTVQVFGTFNSGSVTMQGSNEVEPLNWATLHDHIGEDAILSAAGMILIAENPRHIRAILTGTAGAASVTVLLASRKG